MAGRLRAVARAARRVGARVEALGRLLDYRPEDRREAELERLGDAAFGVGDVAELAGQPHLAEAGERPAVGVAEWLPALSRCDRKGDREIGPRLVDADPAGDVDEDVGVAEPRRRRAGREPRGSSPAGCDRSRLPPAAAARPRSGRPAPGPRRARAACPPSHRGRRSPAAAVASPTKRADGSSTSTRPAGAHLEDADLAGRAEAVLERAQGPVGALALALEVGARSRRGARAPAGRRRSLLGHVADEDQGRRRSLGHRHQRRRPPPAPGRPIRGARELGRVQRLDGVDDTDRRALGLDRLEDGAELGLGQRRDVERASPSRSARIRTWAVDSSPVT